MAFLETPVADHGTAIEGVPATTFKNDRKARK